MTRRPRFLSVLVLLLALLGIAATPAVGASSSAAVQQPEQDATYRPLTIEGLRARSYGSGTISMLGVLSETPAFTRELFAYESDGLRITGQLTRPRGAGPWPVVILNHGYFPLDVYRTGYDTQHASDYLAARGYLCLAPDFRSHAGSDVAPNIFKAGHVIDTLNLVPLAQQLPDARPGKVAMWGHSNGGEITLKALLVSEDIAAGLLYAPASAWLADSYYTYGQGQTLYDPANTADYPLTPEEAPDLYTWLSPGNYLHFLRAPVQWHHAVADPVPFRWSNDPHTLLLGLGKPSELFAYDGGNHSLQGAQQEQYLARTLAFFDAHLGVRRTAP